VLAFETIPSPACQPDFIIVRADEKLTAFLELESAIRSHCELA